MLRWNLFLIIILVACTSEPQMESRVSLSPMRLEHSPSVYGANTPEAIHTQDVLSDTDFTASVSETAVSLISRMESGVNLSPMPLEHSSSVYGANTPEAIHTQDALGDTDFTASDLAIAVDIISRADPYNYGSMSTIDPTAINSAMHFLLSATEAASEDTPFFTRLHCRHPQSRRVTFQQERTEPISLFLDGVVTEIEGVTSLEFSVAPDSVIYIIEEDGTQILPVRKEPIGYCGEDGTPDAPLEAQAELMIFPLTISYDCIITKESLTIGMVIVNTGGVDSGTFQARVTNDGYNMQAAESLIEIDNLPAHSSQLYQFATSMRRGFSQTIVRMEVDSENSVAELNENNNLVAHRAGCFPGS